MKAGRTIDQSLYCCLQLRLPEPRESKQLAKLEEVRLLGLPRPCVTHKNRRQAQRTP